MHTDPGLVPPSSWSARHAALRSRGAPDDDPRVVECRNALAYWRIRRAVDAEQEVLGPAGAAAVNAALLGAMPTGEAAAVTS